MQTQGHAEQCLKRYIWTLIPVACQKPFSQETETASMLAEVEDETLTGGWVWITEKDRFGWDRISYALAQRVFWLATLPFPRHSSTFQL